MFLSMITIDSCIIIHYIAEEHFCHYYLHAFITEEILKHYKIALPLMVNKQLRCLRMLNYGMLN